MNKWVKGDNKGIEKVSIIVLLPALVIGCIHA